VKVKYYSVMLNRSTPDISQVAI